MPMNLLLIGMVSLIMMLPRLYCLRQICWHANTDYLQPFQEKVMPEKRLLVSAEAMRASGAAGKVTLFDGGAIVGHTSAIGTALTYMYGRPLRQHYGLYAKAAYGDRFHSKYPRRRFVLRMLHTHHRQMGRQDCGQPMNGTIPRGLFCCLPDAR